MNCTACERNLSAYIDDQLDGEIRRQLEEHFDACPTCRAEYESHLAVWEAVGSADHPGASGDLWSAVEGQLGQTGQATGIEDLALMLRGLAGQVQELQRSVDEMRRQMEEGEWNAPQEERDVIQIPTGRYRAARPRAGSLEQLKDNPLTQLRRS